MDESPPEITGLAKLKESRLYEGQLTPLPLNLNAKKWDVFISHAGEDKETSSRPERLMTLSRVAPG